MYFMVDAQGSVLSVNRFGSERLGYRKDELIGQNVLNVFHPLDREVIRSNLNVSCPTRCPDELGTAQGA